MNNRRRLVMDLGACALFAPFTLFAQWQAKVWRIGYLDFGSRQSMMESGRYSALIEGLRERGYVEGGNFILEARYADGNATRLGELAAELVRHNVDVMLSTGTPASRAAQRATASIPIVVITVSYPVSDGFAVSLARPGGNITGMSSGNDDTVQKLVELLRIAARTLKRIALLTNPANSSHPPLVSQVQAAAQQFGISVVPLSVRTQRKLRAASRR